jgi:hypothetical protein
MTAGAGMLGRTIEPRHSRRGLKVVALDALRLYGGNEANLATPQKGFR